MNKSTSSSSGTSIIGLLGVMFITLKLCHVIDWSWWWVTCPFWGGLTLALAAVGAAWLILTKFK